MSNDYEFSITKVNYIINRLPQDEREKLPSNVMNFFEKNSNEELLSEEFLNTQNIFSLCNENDKKFLKIVDYYINGK